MKPLYVLGSVRAQCPDCDGAVTTFEFKDTQRHFGTIIKDQAHTYDGKSYLRVLYLLMRCAGCHRGGLATLHDNGKVEEGVLESFLPISTLSAKLPTGVPDGIRAEYREAERCAGVGAWRAASGLLRSTLEKALRANGYLRGSLAARIDEAAADGVITEARKKKAHDEVRVLGNDVLHDEWREVLSDEVLAAHHYVQRILEDFYDDRTSVETLLIAKGRISNQP